MANRIRGSRFGLRRAGRVHAAPMAAQQRGGPGPRARSWLSWGAAAIAVAAVAFIVGRAGSEIEVPSPTPLASVAPLTVTFGTALDRSTGEAIQLTNRFRAGDPIAYSVTLGTAAGADKVLVEIVRVDGGAETVVQPPAEQGISAASLTIAFTFAVSTDELLVAWGPGEYSMRIFLPTSAAPIATGQFTLVETPAGASDGEYGP